MTRIFLLHFLLLLPGINGFARLGGGGGRRLPPRGPPPSHRHGVSSSSEPPEPCGVSQISPWRSLQYNETFHFDEEMEENRLLRTRGGSQKQKNQLPVNDVVKGTQATLSATSTFWGQTFGRVIDGTKRAVSDVGGKVSKRFQSAEKRKEEELMEQLRSMPIQRVVVKDSKVLPQEVIQIATRRSGLLGNPLRSERVQELANTLKQWYERQGYVLHSVTGATLETSTATAEIQVQEPVSAKKPVNIIFCKEMVVEPETGELISVRQYRDRNAVKRKYGGIRERSTDDTLANVNTTFVETQGRTSPKRIAKALGLRANRPFQWKSSRWQGIVKSGIFTKVIHATPQPLPDGTVQLNIVAQEAPTRHLEYGLGKSLYTGSWEGELEFEHANLMGGGEVVGLSVRRGTRDAEPSVRVRFTDDRFGLEGGYDVEAFSDFIGDTSKEEPGELTVHVADTKSKMDTAPASETSEDEADDLLSRRGATFRLRNPFNPEVIRNSLVSASIERTATKTGLNENIGSATLKLGPFRRSLAMDALSSVDTAVTTGTRVVDLEESEDDESSSRRPFELKPYASFTATTRQIVPLLETRTAGKRPLILALQHSATVSSPNLPRHEAKAQGVANNIRGAKSNGSVSSAIRGTTEVRIPVDVPMLKSAQQDTSLVLFGDWLFATKDSTSPIFRKSTVGVGIRKSLQGLPLHCNLCYAGNGRIKTLFGLGRDFEA